MRTFYDGHNQIDSTFNSKLLCYQTPAKITLKFNGH